MGWSCAKTFVDPYGPRSIAQIAMGLVGRPLAQTVAYRPPWISAWDGSGADSKAGAAHAGGSDLDCWQRAPLSAEQRRAKYETLRAEGRKILAEKQAADDARKAAAKAGASPAASAAAS
jgi:hypothetical protein